jgi:ATP-binding cassette subfamily B protein
MVDFSTYFIDNDTSVFLSVVTGIREYDTFSTYFPFILKAQYFSQLITQRRYIKEARLFQYLKFVEAAWEIYLQKFHSAQVKSNLKPRFLVGFLIILQYVVTIIDLFILYPKVTNNSLSFGVFIAVAQAVWSFVGSFQYELIGMIRNRQNFNLFAQDYVVFMNTPEMSEDVGLKITQVPQFSKIVLENIWFRYTEDGPYILRGIDLEIRNGDKIGIVGENGSGKSTLIKILLGLLIQNKGQISIDSELISDSNRHRLRKMMSVVFQDYARFNLTLAESISLNNIDDINNTEKMKKVINSLHRDKNYFTSFENGVDTPLGKEVWEGRDLSGGEWQTVTLARALFSGRSMLILDEPTASLDPMAEVDVYKHIYHSSDVRTLIMITHRLGGVVQAGQIFLLADGVIAESGSHLELLQKQGRYSQIFNTQRQWYVRDSSTGNKKMV